MDIPGSGYRRTVNARAPQRHMSLNSQVRVDDRGVGLTMVLSGSGG
jgi:hypothetical protein